MTRQSIYARQEEISVLQEMLDSDKPEFLAMYGRRRIGKTFLIKQFFENKKNIFLKVTGLKDGTLAEQLENFVQQLAETFYKNALPPAPPKNWSEAFNLLTRAIKTVPKSKKVIIFFDELPWMATAKSKLLQRLDYTWNQHWSDDPRIKLIVCGSSSAWIINKIINSKGGLHNRITQKIHLRPFNLKETKEFLAKKEVSLNNQQIAQLYMVTGGVPYYLDRVRKGLSATQIIEKLAFTQKSLLLEEFNNLFSALFDKHEVYIDILRIIASNRYGIGKEELLKKIGKSQQGQGGIEKLQALEDADFIISFKPHFHKRKGIYYRIIDEFTLFYFHWIEPIKKTLQERSLEKGYWSETQHTPAWSAWAGYAFEAICYKHLSQIRKKLEISPIAIADSWRYVPKKDEGGQGAQIDLLFDRKDNAITLCEIKYSNKPYTLTKEYINALLQKAEVLKKQTGTTKQLFWAMISANGLANNFYADSIINGIVTLDDLFKDN